MNLFAAQEFKTHEKITDNSEDEFIDQLALATTAYVENFCRRSFAKTAYTESYDGTGTDVLILRNWPVNSVTEINIDPARTFGASTIVLASTYVVSTNSGRVQLINQVDNILVTGGLFSKGIKNVQVKYDAGYLDTASVPWDLKLGAMRWASTLRTRRTAAGIRSRTIGGYSVTYAEGDQIPKVVKDLIGHYRSPGMAALGGYA